MIAHLAKLPISWLIKLSRKGHIALMGQEMSI